VTNEAEDAYEATLYVAMPSNVSYVKTEMVAFGGTTSEVANVLCSPPTSDNGFVLKCDLGNPMLGFSSVRLKNNIFFVICVFLNCIAIIYKLLPYYILVGTRTHDLLFQLRKR
jgi:hypothetical protein